MNNENFKNYMNNLLHKALQFQWDNSTQVNVRLCGKAIVGKRGRMLVFENGEDLPKSGAVMRCLSPTSCVVCSQFLAQCRQEWLEKIFLSGNKKNMDISTITLKVDHTTTDSLLDLTNVMEQAYTNIQGCSAMEKLRSSFHSKFVRVLDIGYGKNGFHPQFRLAVIHDKGANIDSYTSLLENIWVMNIKKNGGSAPKSGAVVITECLNNEQRTQFLTDLKGTNFTFISGAQNDLLLNENINIWQVHSYAVAGNLAALNIWKKYDADIKGKRTVSPSRGLEAFFGVKWEGQAAARMNGFEYNADNLHYVK